MAFPTHTSKKSYPRGPRMKIKHCSLLTISILFACNVNAAGFQVAEHSASGLGRAFSGEAAVADNASVLARNPAAMTLFDTAQFSGALSIVDPEVDVNDVTNNQYSKDVAPMQFVPASYYISPINDKWAWGVGLFTTYGVGTDYPDSIAAGDMAGNTSLASVNLNPNIAYRVNDNFSVGAGVNLVYAIAELDRHKGSLYPFIGGSPSDKLVSMEGNTFAFGWNIGALYEINENHRFGFGYRSSVNLDFDDGKFTDHGGTRVSDSSKNPVKGQLKIELPDIVELSGFHQLNSQWAVHYSWQRTMWNKFKELRATSPDCDLNDGVCFLKKEDYSDNNRYSVGATYSLDSQWTLRAGLAFDEQAGKTTLSIPDSDRTWYSTGVTYAYSKNLTFDAGFALVKSKSGSFKEKNAGDQELTFESSGSAYITALQVNYAFN
ncbi:putative Toluene_X, Outer membrane protein transport protein or FadL, Long-chain fatty acid transport protein [Vibrio nigripulchritudo MADA3029]|nr:putative Toluene_X, Outer membrane protein transport protein or FadL, Long-chain fatty acid transport protein [Vibrio nigripulchritudo MADA3020]CCN54349.1 putative Toluene_X, Outer membrane protein transport protein or FadL, Long-chain fatty acid transport protein [Vibrio nigripulchritudo MADA3021]CCN58947.1 putative Toluene_X, Outer membrane protein transport protein or FadL, Long-chain fatty acid transport protein [Vibrio nigripulchritudo MADA3029]